MSEKTEKRLDILEGKMALLAEQIAWLTALTINSKNQEPQHRHPEYGELTEVPAYTDSRSVPSK